MPQSVVPVGLAYDLCPRKQFYIKLFVYNTVVLDGSEVLAISLWDQKENADAYSRETYPEVLKTLGKVVQGIPQVQTHEVSSSTFHKITAHAAA
jgi:hypothetical protein